MKTMTLALSTLLLAGSLGVISHANAAQLAAWNGMTLYVFDKDVGGIPSCYGECAALWPPAIAKQGEKGEPGVTALRSVQSNEAVSCEANETLVSVLCPSGGVVEGAKCASAPTVGLCLLKQ